MSAVKICRICLRTDKELRVLNDPLSEFFEELCDYTNDNTTQLSCPSCEHLLEKCYNFKKHCQKANKIFLNWKKKKSQNKKPIEELHQQIPPFELRPNNKCKDIEIVISKDIITTEIVDIKDENNYNDYELEAKIENITVDFDNDGNDNDENLHQTVENNNVENHHQTTGNVNDNHEADEDMDDVCLSDLLNGIKKKSSKVKVKVKKDAKMKTEVVLGEETDEPKIKRQRARKPLTNQQDYETVFDIRLFESEADALREFAERKHSAHYRSAAHKCHVCFSVFKCAKLLDFHMKWHDPSAGDFPCNVCAMRFKRYVSMRKHKNDVHFGLFKCKRCPLITYHKMVMMHHYQKHQGVEFKCKHCNGVYRHSSTYMTHLRTRHKTDHVCVTCARTFVSENGLIMHRKKVHKTSARFDSDATAECKECALTFSTHEVYIVHVLNTPKHKDLASAIIGCPECGRQFEDKLQVRAHRRQCHPAYNYSAMKHGERMKAEGGSGERVFVCKMCGKSGTHNTWLYRHFLSEHPQTPYEQLHNERRKHLCEECGRSFFTITALREHQHIHTGAKPFSCDQCPAEFRRSVSLKMHLERHLPPSRECQHCEKKFASASNLSNHMRSHIGDRRYKCEICTKGFLHAAALREHVRGVHHRVRRPRPRGGARGGLERTEPHA